MVSQILKRTSTHFIIKSFKSQKTHNLCNLNARPLNLYHWCAKGSSNLAAPNPIQRLGRTVEDGLSLGLLPTPTGRSRWSSTLLASAWLSPHRPWWPSAEGISRNKISASLLPFSEHYLFRLKKKTLKKKGEWVGWDNWWVLAKIPLMCYKIQWWC